MDLLRFDALVESTNRVKTMKKIDWAWLNLASSQGTPKTLKEVLAPLQRTVKSVSSKKDGKAFQQRLKGMS